MKNKINKPLQITLVAFLVVAAFFAGGLTTVPGYGATEFNGTPTSGSAVKLNITQDGWYYVGLKGAAGNDGNNYAGGSGGHIKGLVYFDKTKDIQIVTYAGGRQGYAHKDIFAGKGGDAIALIIDGTMVLGAAGGSGGCGTSQDGDVNSYGKPVTETTINASDFSSGGGGGCYWYQGNEWRSSSGQPGHGGAAGGNSSNSGAAGKNYVDESNVILIHMENGNTDKNTSYSIALVNEITSLPTTEGSFVTGTEYKMYKSPTKMVYTLMAQSKGGDIMVGDITCSKDDILEVLMIGDSVAFRHNYEDLVLLAASPGGALTGTTPSLMNWTDTKSYFDGDLIINSIQDSTTKAGSVSYKITAKNNLEEIITSVIQGEYPSFNVGSTVQDIITKLPSSVTGLTNKGNLLEFNVNNWSCEHFEVSKPGIYVFEADIDTSNMDWVFNELGLKAKASIQVTDISNTQLQDSIMQKIVALTVPTINVVEGKPFDLVIAAYPSIESGTYNGITIENPNKNDNVIRIKGTLSDPGSQVITIDDKDFIFHVIKEPHECATTVVLK